MKLPFPSLEDCGYAESYFTQGDHITAMEVIEDSILKQGKDNVLDCYLLEQGFIFMAQAKRLHNTDVKFTFRLGSVECSSVSERLSSFCAISLSELGDHLGSSLYYKKTIDKAKEYLSLLPTFRELGLEAQKRQKDIIERVICEAESRIAGAKTLVGSVEKSEPKARESKKNPDPKLRSCWMGLNDDFKRNFLKISTKKLLSFSEAMYGKDAREALKQLISYAKENRKWRFLMCRTCSKKFSSPEKCKNHLEQVHAAEFKPSSTKDMAQMVSKAWARKITNGDWVPVDTVAAVEMIKNRLQDVKAFTYENGWSKDWPLASDEERSHILKEIQLLLESFWKSKILPCSIRDWMMQFVVKHLAQFEVSEHTIITECHLANTPQSICFLECGELRKILPFLKNIKGERDDGTDLVCRAVDSVLDGTRVKEKIDFDLQFSFLLLDKRLLTSKLTRFDNEGTVNVFDPNDYYAEVQAHGDDILSWLAYDSSGDESIRFPRPIRTHNIDFWVAVLRAVQFTCRNLGTKYEKKLKMISYDAALLDAKKLCIREDERRRNILDDQSNTYASLLGKKCEEHIRRDSGNSLATKLFLCAVRDVLEGASQPTFDFVNVVDCLNLIHTHKHISDDIVLKSIDLLKSVVTNKVPLLDSKILLVENSRIKLLNNLVRLSVFDYRSYILQPLKHFLQEELVAIVDKDAKAKLDAALKEKEKKLGSKKKHHSNKTPSTSMSSFLGQNVEHFSVNLEPGVTSPSVNMAEEDSVELEDTFPSVNMAEEDSVEPEVTSPSLNMAEEDSVEPEVTSPSLNMGEEDSVEPEVTSPSLNMGEEDSVEPEDTFPSLNMAEEDSVEPEVTSPSLNMAEEDSVEPEDTSPSFNMGEDDSVEPEDTREKGQSEISSNTYNQEEATKDMHGEDSLSKNLESVHGKAVTRYNSALDMILKSLCNSKVLKEDLVHNRQPFFDNQVPSALRSFFSAFFSDQIKEEGCYSHLLSNILASLEEVHSLSRDGAEVLVAILEFCHCWKSPERESLVTRLFTLEEYERMSCRKCRRKPNYPEQSSYGIVMAADSIRDLKYAFGNINFEDILKMIRMDDKMICDVKTGGCGETNVVHHTISRCPPIFTIVLGWEKHETEKEIFETTKALNWEIDLSRLYEGLEPNTKYRLMSMIGCSEEEEYICMAYKKNRWVSLRHEASAEEGVGNWKKVANFVGERKIRPEILFYESCSMD